MAIVRIPVIDLFAGPGGLGEGFAAYCLRQRSPAYRIALSVEKDGAAHRTLELRAFFRQFALGAAPSEYYDHLRTPTASSRNELFAKYPEESEHAQQEAWNAELGVVPEPELDRRIKVAISRAQNWLLIGGPPCRKRLHPGTSRIASASSSRIVLQRQ